MRNKLVIGVMVVLLFCGGLAQSEPITIQISGNVTSANGSALPSTIYQDVTFTGTYSYDSSATDSGGGHYNYNDPYGINLSLGGFEFKTSSSHVGQFEISILDNYAPYGNIHDDYWVQSLANSQLSNGTLINSISWHLLDGSHTALSSSDLPVTAPKLNEWDWNRLEISGPENSLSIEGTVTQVFLIPEPFTGILMAMGVLFLRRYR